MLSSHYEESDRSENWVADRYGRDLLADLPEGAILITEGDDTAFVLDYLLRIEGLRLDVSLYNRMGRGRGTDVLDWSEYALPPLKRERLRWRPLFLGAYGLFGTSIYNSLKYTLIKFQKRIFTMTMSHNLETEMKELLDKIRSIAKSLSYTNKRAQSLSERILFRGESECHKEISSGLYRQLHEIKNINFDIMDAQKRQLAIAKTYTKNTDDFEILSQIQHLGGKTNLIDFTTDLNIALFFACCHAPDKDGRIIFFPHFMSRNKKEYFIHSAIEPSNMIDVQKSVFVIPTKGYIQEDTIIVRIPAKLKKEILDHLQLLYGMEASTVYNDLSGFIRDQEKFKDYEAEFYAALSYYDKGEYTKTIEHCTNYIKHPSTLWRRGQVYWLRSITYIKLGKKEKAFEDYRSFKSRDWPDKPEFPSPWKEKFEKMGKKLNEQEERKRKKESTTGEKKLDIIFCFIVRVYDEQENPVSGVDFSIVSESGYNYSQEVAEGDAESVARITLPIYLYYHKDSIKNWLWFHKDGYTSVHDVLFQWSNPSEFTMEPIEDNQGEPKVTIRVEPKLYDGEKSISEEEASKLLKGS